MQFRSNVLASAAVMSLAIGTGGVANAAVGSYTLSVPNASITINPKSQSGVSDFDINGVNQLNQEWFWYRDNSSTQQVSIDTLDLTSVSALDTDGDGRPDYLITNYSTSNGAAHPFTLTASYSLVGGRPGNRSADLAEAINITNTGSTTLNYVFYAYADFTLNGAPTDAGETTNITGGNTATVHAPSGASVSQTTINPMPSEYQASQSPTTLTELDNTPSLVLGDNASSPGGEWAFEYDLCIAPNHSAIIALDKNICAVPEPLSAATLLMIGGASLLRRRRML